MPTSGTYCTSADATEALEALVNQIEANPGNLIRPGAYDDCLPLLDPHAVLASLPAEISEADFLGILRLALLTESATESYAGLINDIGRESDAGWLSRFTRNVWAPDEITHHAPYRSMLLCLGFSASELDRDIRDVQEKVYSHTGGRTPVHITTYGMVQEYLTDNYHGLIARLLKGTAPQATAMVMHIKRRETLHTAWYRDMTAIQLEANPRLVEDVASEMSCFDMPGSSLVPELQEQGKRWQQLMGVDVDQVFRDLLRLMHDVLGNTRLTGEFVLKLAAEKNVAIGPLSARQVSSAIERLGGIGHGLIGEAVLDKAGLGYTFKRTSGRQDSAFQPYQGVQARIRDLLRGWIRDHIPSPAGAMLTP